MDISAIIGVAVIGAVICVVIKQYKPEYAALTAVCTGVVILLFVIPELTGVFDFLKNISQLGRLDTEYGKIVSKALGICIITQLASDTCKDCGQNSIATKLELGGKISVLLVSMPIFIALIETVQRLMNI